MQLDDVAAALRREPLDASSALDDPPCRQIPSIVELGPSLVFAARAVCDDITEPYRDKERRDLGALTPGAMAAVNSGLRAALSLPETGR